MRKNKKLLLASVAAMGALALGVGATSTFAWFAAGEASAVAKTSEGTMSTIGVTQVDYSAAELEIKLTVTASANCAGLGLAHYNSSDDNDEAKPFLTTGYMDQTNTFHDLGYNADHSPKLGSWNEHGTSTSASVTKLHEKLSFTIAVDYNGNGWYQEATCETPATAVGNATHFKDGAGNIYTKAYVLEKLSGEQVYIGVKPGTSSRVKFYKTAASGSGDFGDSTMLASPNQAYANVASATLGADGGATVATGADGNNANFYVHGQGSGTNGLDSASVSSQAVDLIVVAQ